jgi:two-component system sensor histidine kinase YesM
VLEWDVTAMRRKIRANKVFLKIFLVTALAVIISVVSCLVFILTYFRSNFQDLLFERSRDSVLKMTEQVSNNLEELVSLGQIIAFDDSVQKTLLTAKKTDNVYNYYSTIQTGKLALKKYVTLRSDIVYDIVLINKNDEILEMDNTYEALFKTDDYSIVHSKENGFIPVHKFTYNVNIGYWQVISYVCNVYSKDDYSYIGKIVILAKNQSAIEDLLSFDKNTGIDLGLYNSNGKLFYSTDYTRDLKNEIKNSGKSRDYYITENLSITGWNIICSVSGNLINSSINNTYRLIFIILVLVLIFMMIIIYSLVFNITNPLYKLIGGMRRVSNGERRVSLSIHTGDEIEEVSHVFNEMVHDIETRTQELLESQNKENETKIRMLIYQINPHFIYNTLNCVICLARMNDDEGIISLTRTFITLLRGVISTDTNSYTVIQDEISYIDNYVKVLQYSYNNIPFIKWEVDEELLANEILKQTLYPLVENSIFHGILPVDHPSELTVSIKKSAGDLIAVTVADNGRGMNADEVEKLREQLLIGESVDGKHIGLQNINNRLKLIYGDASAISIESRFGEGTVMSFSYPVLH